MSDVHFEAALVKEACPLCGKTEDGPIIINRCLTKHFAAQVKKLHGQTIGYMDKPCEECRKYMKQGFLLIGIIEEKTDDMKNPYRSGNIWVIKHEAAKKLFPDMTKGAVFLDINDANALGLPGITNGDLII